MEEARDDTMKLNNTVENEIHEIHELDNTVHALNNTVQDGFLDLSNTVGGLDDNIKDNSAKIEETENLAQNLVDLNDTITAKIHEAETLVQNLDNTLNDLSLNTTSTVDLERLELAENNIIHLNNSLETLVEDLEGISLCWQKEFLSIFYLVLKANFAILRI